MSTASDARYRTKVYLDTYLDPDKLTKDNDETQVTFIVCYADPPYSIIRLFSYTEKEIDLVFAIGDPVSEPLIDAGTQAPYAYEEHVPIWVYCIDRAGLITGNLLKWKAEKELRRILENYPHGSYRRLERRRDTTQDLGFTRLYSLEFLLSYTRSTDV